jgi:steroid delta-isomerase-like uncharacterized protein
MQNRTVRLIDSYYAAFNRGDTAGMLALLDEGVVHHVNQGGTEAGKPAFAKFLDKMNRHYREEVRDLVVMATEDGRRAAAEFKVKGVYLKSDAGLPEARGQEYLLPVGAFFEVADDRIQRVTNYYNLKAWLDMVE